MDSDSAGADQLAESSERRNGKATGRSRRVLGWLDTALGRMSSVSGVIGLIVAFVALNLSQQANTIATDAAQRSIVTAAYLGCYHTGYFYSGKDPRTGDYKSTYGDTRYFVLSNTGRLPVMIVGAKGVLETKAGIQRDTKLNMSWIRLSDPSSATPSVAALYLAPGEGAAVALGFDMGSDDERLVATSYEAADATGSPIEVRNAADTNGLPDAVADLYARLAEPSATELLGRSNANSCAGM